MWKVIALFCFLVSAAHAADCASASSHANQRACLERAAEKSAAAVDATEAAVRKRIAAWDEDAQFKQQSLSAFEDAAARFRQYESSQCEFEASSAAGGNGAGDIRLQCKLRLERAYVQDLKQHRSWFSPPHA